MSKKEPCKIKSYKVLCHNNIFHYLSGYNFAIYFILSASGIFIAAIAYSADSFKVSIRFLIVCSTFRSTASFFISSITLPIFCHFSSFFSKHLIWLTSFGQTTSAKSLLIWQSRIPFCSKPLYLLFRICPRRIIIMQFFLYAHMLSCFIIVFLNPMYILNRKIRADFQCICLYSSPPNIQTNSEILCSHIHVQQQLL